MAANIYSELESGSVITITIRTSIYILALIQMD